MHKLGVIVPFRNRETQLRQFLREVPKFLDNQGIVHEIIVVEQMDEEDFNRGALLNAGVLEAEARGCDYVALHDVDLIPRYADYSYVDIPVEMVGKILDDSYEEGFQITLEDLTDDYFGGVVLFPVETFKKVNGYSNKYAGWGFEDNDLLKRCQECQVPLDIKKYRQLSNLESSLYFNGKNSYVEFPLGKLNLGRSVSFLVSFKVEDLTFDKTKIGDEACVFSIPGLDLALAYTNYGTYKFEVFDNYEDVYSIHSTKLPVGMACQACITLDAEQRRIVFYLNGVEIGSKHWPVDRNLIAKSNKLYLGVGNPARKDTEKWFTGQISDFAVFKGKVLSQSEVSKAFSESYLGLGPMNPSIWLSAKVFKDNLFLPDLGDSGMQGVVRNCEVTPMLSLTETYNSVVPFKRYGKYRCLPHKTNGGTWGYWKNWATRLNQERFKLVESLGSFRHADGLSTLPLICKMTCQDLGSYVKMQVFFNRSLPKLKK